MKGIPAVQEFFSAGPGLATFGHSRNGDNCGNRAASIAHKIVGTHGAAEIGPGARFPITDESDFAHISLEALSFAHWGVRGSPKLALRCRMNSGFGQALSNRERGREPRRKDKQMRMPYGSARSAAAKPIAPVL